MNLDNLQYESKNAWPEAVIEYPNLKDALLLQEDFAARNSETTAILTYIYQSYILGDVDEKISKILEEVAIIEMHHHEILGDMIVKLGGNPVIGASGNWWSGSNITYIKNVREMMMHNIKIEQIAIANYKKTILKISNNSIKEVIERIIQDELVHIQTFNAILDYITFWK